MGFGNRPKVYMGRDGFRGVSEIRRTSYLERYAVWQKKPKVYFGSGGVSARTALASGGIASGGMVRVRSGERVVAVKPSVKPKVEAVIPKKDECVPPKEERGNGMKPEEKRLADFLEAAQEVKPKCEDFEKPNPPPETEESIAARVAESRAVLPELPLGEAEQPKKKRRRRKGRKAKAEEAGELKLTEVAI